LETAVEAIITISESGIVESFNKTAERMFGYVEAEVVGHNIRLLMPQPYSDEHDQYLANYLRTGQKKIIGIGREAFGRRKDGTVFPIQLAVSEVVLDGGRFFTGFIQDITAKREADVALRHKHEELLSTQHKLIQSERLAAIGEAMTRLAHESRNALQRSQICLELLDERLADRQQDKELLNEIQRSQDDLHRLYEEVRRFAAPIVIEPMLRHIGNVVHESWNDLAGNRIGRDVRFTERAVCDDLQCEIDTFAMGQVFRNIFDNALAACADPVQITVQYRAIEHNGSPCLEVTIHNNGPALNSEQQKKVFQPFFTTKRTGTGLGMAIASRIVDAHHGQISVHSADGAGAEFVVVVPRKRR
jgi:PAS domain S-box-containing protein